MGFYQIFIFNFKVLDNRFGPATGLTFASWMAFAIPVMSVNLVLSWAWLYFQNWVTEKRRKKKQRVILIFHRGHQMIKTLIKSLQN